jgi:excisionase family DNA binding protein
MSTRAQTPKHHDIRGDGTIAEARYCIAASPSIERSSPPGSDRTQPGEKVQHLAFIDDTSPTQETFLGPLAVPPRQACRLLCIGLTRLYELLHAGELESYRHGRSRRITIASIRAYIVRHLRASPTTWGPPP